MRPPSSRCARGGGAPPCRAAVDELVEDVPVNGVFEVVREMTPA
jgi:hypothetical protein